MRLCRELVKILGVARVSGCIRPIFPPAVGVIFAYPFVVPSPPPANQRTLADIEDAFYGIFANFPSKTLSLAMRGVAFPTGRCYHPPSDTLAQEVSQIISTDTQVMSGWLSRS